MNNHTGRERLATFAAWLSRHYDREIVRLHPDATAVADWMHHRGQREALRILLKLSVSRRFADLADLVVEIEDRRKEQDKRRETERRVMESDKIDGKRAVYRRIANELRGRIKRALKRSEQCEA